LLTGPPAKPYGLELKYRSGLRLHLDGNHLGRPELGRARVNEIDRKRRDIDEPSLVMHFAGESSGRKACSIGKGGLDRSQSFGEPDMLLDSSGTANIARYKQPDGSQGDGRDGERNQGLDEGESRAGV
jgi:hypothetical protein